MPISMVNLVNRKARRSSEAKKISRYLKKAEAEINKLEIWPRIANKYPFDIAALAIVSKVFALAKGCLQLLNSGLPDEAFGLSRSIVECSTNLRYLTADADFQQQRTRDFAKYAVADKAFWAHYALQQFAGKKEEREIREYIEKEGIVPNTKPARRHWSGLPGFIWEVSILDHPLDGPVTLEHKKVSYAADYFQTSAWVHCSLPAIDNYFVDDMTPFRVSHSSGLHETTQTTLFIILIYVHTAIAYALFGMGGEGSRKLDSLFSDTLQEMKPARRD